MAPQSVLDPAGGTTIVFGSVIPKISPHTAAISGSFFVAAQNDFADRLKWAVAPIFSDANHPPKVRISNPIDVSARPRSTFTLEGKKKESRFGLTDYPSRRILG